MKATVLHRSLIEENVRMAPLSHIRVWTLGGQISFAIQNMRFVFPEAILK